MPALVIGNPVDPTHPLFMARELAAAIPGARFAEVPSKSIDKAGYVRGVQDQIGAFLTGLLA
ncbi:MAG: hypothetical protein IPK16_27125 [Anaerolineales bacterium]|nr:hypothetical protein [Anaerolineales bacterium]